MRLICDLKIISLSDPPQQRTDDTTSMPVCAAKAKRVRCPTPFSFFPPFPFLFLHLEKTEYDLSLHK